MKNPNMRKRLWILGISFILIGVIVSAVGFKMGADISSIGYSYNGSGVSLGSIGKAEKSEKKIYDWSSVANIQFDVEVGRIIVKQGDKLEVMIENVPDKYIRIDRNGDSGSLEILSPPFSFKKHDFQVTLTLPRDKKLNKIILESDTGGIDGDVLYADYIQLNNDTGRINFDKIECTTFQSLNDTGKIKLTNLLANSAMLENDTGSVTIANFELDTLSLELDTGKADIKGNIKNSILLSCDTGIINANLKGNASDYTITKVSDVGIIKIDGDTGNESGMKNMNLESDVGKISVQFY